MGAAVAIRADMEAAELRRLARRERDGRVAARLIALANALDGIGPATAARAAGMDRQTLRDWVIRFNAEGVGGLRDQPRPPATDDGGAASGIQSHRAARPRPGGCVHECWPISAGEFWPTCRF